MTPLTTKILVIFEEVFACRASEWMKTVASEGSQPLQARPIFKPHLADVAITETCQRDLLKSLILDVACRASKVGNLWGDGKGLEYLFPVGTAAAEPVCPLKATLLYRISPLSTHKAEHVFITTAPPPRSLP